MIEKLLENWLDNASERSYQPVFVQLLAAAGYEVLHSTRHCLLEFGKDVLAIAPDGIGCAFQLKGAPKGRMKIGEFRSEIQPQLVQLMTQAPSYPGFPSGPHRAYLVSNGQFEEEVQTAVREMNAMPFYPAKVELWSRGTLFELCQRYGATLWPGELEDNRALLELYMANPRDQLPIALLANMLNSVLKLDNEHPKLGKNELARAASSATWLTGISISTFAEKENHQAVALAWTICAVSVIGAVERHDAKNIRAVDQSLELAETAILDALSALWHEVNQRKHLIEGDAMTDPEILGWRMSILCGLLSCLAHADMTRPILATAERTALHSWLKSAQLTGVLWGEASIGHLMPWMIWMRKNNPSNYPDELISMFAKAVVKANQSTSKTPLPPPYYLGESVFRHKTGVTGGSVVKISEDEKIAGAAYTAEPLLHLLVRTRNKSYCQSVWPDFTRLTHESFYFESRKDFCLLKASTGVNETKVYPSYYQWSQLRNDALNLPETTFIPEQLKAKCWLLGMWWQVAPHRLNCESLWHFTEAILPN